MHNSPARRRGGPRTFDRNEALDTAMKLFWQQGYEGTSVGDLTRAMGIAPPSLYAAFGNKAALYKEALALYASDIERQLDVGAATNLVDAERNLLRRAVERVTEPDGRTGCMISFGLVEHGADSDDVATAAREQRQAMKRRIAVLLSPWLAEGAADHRAWLLMAVLGGMAIAARDGASRAELYAITEEAVLRRS